MTEWASGAGTSWWLVALFALVGLVLGHATGRRLATGGYRIESDAAGDLPSLTWWPGPALAVLWGFLAWRLGDQAGWAVLPAYLLFAWVSIALVWVDADVHRLPDGLLLPAFPALLALLTVASAADGQWGRLVAALVTAGALFALFFVMALVAPVGYGDVKLMGLVGLVTGWLGPGYAVTAVLAGFLAGGVVAMGMLVGRRAGLGSHIAYGPPLLVGVFVALAIEYRIVA